MEEFVHTHNNRDEYVCSLATRAHLLFDVMQSNHLDRSLFVSAKTARVHEVIFLLFFIFLGLRFW